MCLTSFSYLKIQIQISNATYYNFIINVRAQEERQQRLREQARRLISETRHKSTGNDNNSPTSPTKLKRFNYTPERTISPIHNGSGSGSIGESSYVDVVSTKKLPPSWDKGEHHTSPSHRISDGNSSPLQSFNAVVDRISPKHEKRVSTEQYRLLSLSGVPQESPTLEFHLNLYAR